MAWEEFERNGVKGITGDAPIDEFALALKRIATKYEDRFSRKPTVIELLSALETVIGTHPERYVSDVEGLRFGEITVNRDYERDSNYVDTTQYEGVYIEKTLPGYYAVLQKDSDSKKRPRLEVIKIPTLEVQDRILVCEYEILTNDITEKVAESLIMSVLLGDYLEHFYKDKVDKIEFVNVQANKHKTIAYPS